MCDPPSYLSYLYSQKHIITHAQTTTKTNKKITEIVLAWALLLRRHTINFKTLINKTFNWGGFLDSFRGSILYHHDRENGGMQEDVVWKLRVLHLPGKMKSTKSYTEESLNKRDSILLIIKIINNIIPLDNKIIDPTWIKVTYFLQQGHIS